MNQTEARAEAKRLNDQAGPDFPLVAVARTVPPNAWGGHELEWTVDYVPKERV